MHQKIALFISRTREDPTLKRILFIILLHAITPAIFIIIYMNIGQRQTAVKTYEENLVQIARFASNSFNEEFLLIKSTLVTLSSLPEIRQMAPQHCEEMVSAIIMNNSDSIITALGATDKDGNVICTTLPQAQMTNISDREHFMNAQKTGQFIISDYRIGAITNQPIIVAANPIFDMNNQFSGIVFASINLKSLNKLAENVKLPENFTLTVFDDSGKVVSRYPDLDQWLGFDSSNTSLGQTMLKQSASDGVFTADGLDGTQRIYAYSKIEDSLGKGTLTVTLGTPESEINKIANKNIWRDSGILLAIIFLAVLILSIDLHFILRRLKNPENLTH